MKLAIVPGSFDPMTNGHLDLIRRAARLFDRVVAVVMDNREKHYLFSRDERFALVRESDADIPGVDADVWAGICGEYVRDCGACAIVKGVRSTGIWYTRFCRRALTSSSGPGRRPFSFPPRRGWKI